MKLNFKEKKQQNKGITLIALIITIIVLLILAVVAIREVQGDGIISKAKKAKEDYEKAQSEEQSTLDEYLSKIESNVPGGEVQGPWKQEGDTITNPATKQTLKVADYVNYDPTLGATEAQMTYTSYSLNNASSDKNNGRTSGYDQNQSFDARTYKNAGYKWQVLDVKDGKIRLISNEYVGPGNYSDQNRTKYYLKGQAGYINGVEELNTICGIFGHGKGAEGAASITVDDINAITGYNPNSPKFNQGEWNEYGNKVTYTKGDGDALSSSATNGKTWSGTRIGTFNYYDSTTRTFKPLTGTTTIESTIYWYYPAKVNSSFLTGGVNEDGTQNTTSVYQMLFGGTAVGADNMTRNYTLKNNQYFWLASDYTYTREFDVDWGIRYVEHGCVDYCDVCFSTYNYFGVRPVVSLKSDIQLEPNGNNNWKIK